MAVSIDLADYLKSPHLIAGVNNSSVSSAWGDDARTIEVTSPYADREEALDEAERQLAFHTGPLARDTHLVSGIRDNLIGKTVEIDGADIFIIEADVDHAAGMTSLTGLRRLS